MVRVTINGEETAMQVEDLPKVTDIVELIKSTIDPDHMITQILIDGSELDEGDWSKSPSQLGETAIIEIETGTPTEFVATRFSMSSDIVKACFLEFREARKSFQDGNMQDGNQQLGAAVNTLQAFLEWYCSLIDLVPVENQLEYDISERMESITEICKKICQQQLYQSWWALGESIKESLEPKLEDLEDFCRKFRQARAA